MKSTSLFLPLGQPRSLQQTAHVRNDLRLLEVSGDILDTLVKEGMIIKVHPNPYLQKASKGLLCHTLCRPMLC